DPPFVGSSGTTPPVCRLQRAPGEEDCDALAPFPGPPRYRRRLRRRRRVPRLEPHARARAVGDPHPDDALRRLLYLPAALAADAADLTPTSAVGSRRPERSAHARPSALPSPHHP